MKSDFASSGFFVVRTPLLPIGQFLDLGRRPAAADIGEADSRSGSRETLRRWEKLPLVREALWLASPEFAMSLDTWRESPDTERGRSLERTLYRYFARMSSRATPFGTFAGCSVGQVSDRTHLEIGSRETYRRRTRLDMEYLVALAEGITSDTDRLENLRLRPNTSLHLAAGIYHHLQGSLRQGAKSYALVATEPSEVLDATLRRAAPGATAAWLAKAIEEHDPEVSLADARGFIGKLVASQLLVCDLIPPVTSEAPLSHMVRQLEQGQQHSVAGTLRTLAEKMQALDAQGLGASLRSYDEIRDLAAHLSGISKPGRLVQVDLIKRSPAACLDRKLVADIRDGCELLHAMHGEAEESVFRGFKDDFRDRYQDREVPLLEALDDEAGVGFEGEANTGVEPLLEGLDFWPVGNGPAVVPAPAPALLRALQQTWAQGSTLLTLDDDVVGELRGPRLPLPDSFAAMGTCFATAEGRYGFVLGTVLGTSGVNLATRFCDADEGLLACVRDHVRAESALQSDATVLAEIAHLAEARDGNVVCRPALREYEIPVLATSALSPDRQISLSDLTIAVRDDRIVLRSRRLRREVLPRLTTAHNFLADRCLKLYKFLCLLQLQGVTTDLAWRWGALEQAAFLPRVVRNNIVLSLARWRITPRDVAELDGPPPAERMARVRDWRNARGLPRFAYLSESDNQLLIDFENALAIDVLLEHVTKHGETLLVEMFPSPEALACVGPEGHFVHEVVVPFIRTQAAVRRSKEASPLAAPQLAVRRARAYLPGSEWLVAKLYCSPSHADRLLLDLVRPLVAEVLDGGTADGWYFIRYADPHWHIRLRLHGDPQHLTGGVLPKLTRFAQAQQSSGRLWRLQLDTYDQELERYGGPDAIGIAERLFQHDSELCLSLLGLVATGGGPELRWQFAVCGVDRLLSALGFTPREKKTAVEGLARFFEQDYTGHKNLKKQLAQKFRERRRVLQTLLVPDGARSAPLPVAAVDAFARYATAIRELRDEYRAIDHAARLTCPMSSIAESFVHMHLNRVLRSSAVRQEIVVYEFLSRLYASQIAMTTA